MTEYEFKLTIIGVAAVMVLLIWLIGHRREMR